MNTFKKKTIKRLEFDAVSDDESIFLSFYLFYVSFSWNGFIIKENKEVLDDKYHK